MNYPKEVWLKAFLQESKPWRNKSVDLECSNIPLEGWQKYRRVDESETPKGMKLSRVETLDGRPVRCFVEDK